MYVISIGSSEKVPPLVIGRRVFTFLRPRFDVIVRYTVKGW
jgi:hypothetical protein